jgi:hypothetical protein
MRALLLSAYSAVSHRFWAEQVMAHTDAEWTCLSLPPRHFRWRIRGNPLTWALKEHHTLSQPYDLVLATSMVDVATLIGLYPHLGRAKKVVYFHENQFAYPESDGQVPQVEAKMVNLYAALAADQVVFNSAYNRDSFIDGARLFLKRLPENLPAATLLETLRQNVRVMPVPILPLASDTEQQFRQTPPVFDQARERLAKQIVAWGPQPEARYHALLASADIVVSTTWHEFQGLAIMEAVQRGVLPLVPDRLCFPELYPNAYRFDGTREGLTDTLRTWLTAPSSRPTPLATAQWEWPAWEGEYRALLS